MRALAVVAAIASLAGCGDNGTTRASGPLRSRLVDPRLAPDDPRARPQFVELQWDHPSDWTLIDDPQPDGSRLRAMVSRDALSERIVAPSPGGGYNVWRVAVDCRRLAVRYDEGRTVADGVAGDLPRSLRGPHISPDVLKTACIGRPTAHGTPAGIAGQVSWKRRAGA